MMRILKYIFVASLVLLVAACSNRSPEPLIKEETFFNSPVYNDLEQFKKDSDLILCNRNSSELSDVQDKIFTRDIFQQD